MILDGTKKQTTRKPRKNPITVKDTLYCYFKPRMKSSCKNCISPTCKNSVVTSQEWPIIDCSGHVNKFGNAKVIGIRHVGSENTAYFSEWMDDSLNRWAINDGFENFKEADEWFTRVHKVEGRKPRALARGGIPSTKYKAQ